MYTQNKDRVDINTLAPNKQPCHKVFYIGKLYVAKRHDYLGHFWYYPGNTKDYTDGILTNGRQTRYNQSTGEYRETTAEEDDRMPREIFLYLGPDTERSEKEISKNVDPNSYDSYLWHKFLLKDKVVILNEGAVVNLWKLNDDLY